MTNQPDWKFLANLGDASPLDYGGAFVFEDTTGVYTPEIELLEEPSEGDNQYHVFRFSLDRLKYVKGYLVPAAYKPDWPYTVSQYEEWFVRHLPSVAESAGMETEEIADMFTSGDTLVRAQAYLALVGHFGPVEFDQYPLGLSRKEAAARIKTYRN